MRKADWLIGFLIAAVSLLLISYFVKSYRIIQDENPDRPTVEETLNGIGDGQNATLDEEDAYDDEEYRDDTSSYVPDEPTIDDLADLNEVREEKESVPETYNKNVGVSKNFLVVAGTFKQMANAEVQLKKFKNMGYYDAEIGKFNKSTYASLIVDRFATSAEAKQFVKTLKGKHKVDAYVHKKR